MPIASSDLQWRGSTTAGSAGNTLAQTTAGANLGKYVATTAVPDASVNNLFPDETGSENAASAADYQCMFAYNAHATLTLQNASVWIASEVAGGAVTAVAVDSTAASAVGSSSAQALTVADKNTAPAGLTFTAPTTKGTLSIGSLAAGQVRAVWVRRTGQNGAALAGDGAALRFEGDTAP